MAYKAHQKYFLHVILWHHVMLYYKFIQSLFYLLEENGRTSCMMCIKCIFIIFKRKLKQKHFSIWDRYLVYEIFCNMQRNVSDPQIERFMKLWGYVGYTEILNTYLFFIAQIYFKTINFTSEYLSIYNSWKEIEKKV